LWRRPRPKLGCGAKERRRSNENYELIEQLKAEKAALKNTIYSLESELVNLKLRNENFVSEREVKAQLLEELRK
jgi:hypothetical protein